MESDDRKEVYSGLCDVLKDLEEHVLACSAWLVAAEEHSNPEVRHAASLAYAMGATMLNEIVTLRHRLGMDTTVSTKAIDARSKILVEKIDFVPSTPKSELH